MLSRDQILQADDRKFATVDVPEWGGQVRLASLTAAQTLELKSVDLKDDRNAAKMLVRSVVDADGKTIFTDDDLETLMGKSLHVLFRLLEEVMGLNGVSAEAREEQKKSSKEVLSEGLPFGSLSPSVS